MGLLKAFGGALSGSFANQWLEYFTPPATMRDHVVVARAVATKVNGSENNDGEENAGVISNGSKFMVPEGTCLVLVENGQITHVATPEQGEAGAGFTYTTENIPEAQSVFGGNGLFSSTFGQSWNQFKFGGQPGNNQLAFYVNLKALAGFRYGTQNPIRYKDGYYGGAMLAVTSNGTYTLQVVDPILLVKNLVPVDIMSGQGRSQFSLDDEGVTDSLFSGFIGALGEALSSFTKGGKSVDDIQNGITEFASAVDQAVEAKYHWGTQYGLKVVSVEPAGLDWDETSVQQINRFTTGMLMQGNIGNAYAQTQIAEGFNAAGQNGGAAGMMGMGMAMGMNGGMGGAMMNAQGAMPAQQNPIFAQQQAQMQQMQAAQAPAQPAAPATPAPAPVAPEAPVAPATEPEAPAAPEADGDITPEAPIAG